jgi:manganese transport protein
MLGAAAAAKLRGDHMELVPDAFDHLRDGNRARYAAQCGKRVAGQLIMEGFVRFRISIWLRRLITMIPAFIVVALGVNATQALVISQVILSLALPVPMIALLIITRRKDIMRGFANSRTIATVSYIAAGVILAMNGLLIMQIF